MAMAAREGCPPLSEQQRRVLDYIKEHLRKKGFPPSVREIGEAIGLSSSSTVHGHMQRLEEKGYIKRDPAKPRAIEIVGDGAGPRAVSWSIPLVGRVAAGVPILADQNVEDHLPLPAGFVGNDPTALFFLTVQGASMKDAGILDGDYVLVRQQAEAHDGEIVVAMVEGEATVKRFFKEVDHVRLQPENQFMDSIRVRDVEVVGRVVGLIRRLK